MTDRLLDYDEWRAQNIVFCPTCDTETMPLNTGRCGFCDRRLREPSPPKTEEPDMILCLYESCDVLFQRGTKAQEYCSEAHRKAAWNETPKGRAYLEVSRLRRNERKRAKRAAWIAEGLNTRGLPRRDAA